MVATAKARQQPGHGISLKGGWGGHSEDETFYLQEGTLTVQVGGKTMTASAGDVVCLPREVANSFQNTGNVDAKFLVVASPAGFQKFFEEAFYPVEDRSAAMPPMTGESLARLIAAATKVGLEFRPPASRLEGNAISEKKPREDHLPRSESLAPRTYRGD
jgi:uncharacterized cupin superfamily protein